MKKFIAIMFAIIMTVSLAGCNTGKEGESEGEKGGAESLSLEQQVQIAKDTYSNIYNSVKPANLATANATNASANDVSFFEELFDKYESFDNDIGLTLIGTFYSLALPTENLLNEEGVAAIKTNYDVTFNFTNGDVFFLYPETINFHGVSVIDGYNKSFSSFKMNKESEENIYYSTISYFNSVNDFGFDFTAHRRNPDNSIDLVLYYKMDKLTNTQAACQIIGEDPTDLLYIVINKSKAIDSLDSADKTKIDAIFQANYDYFADKSTALEKLNNNGNLKTTAKTKISLPYDVSKVAGFF